MKILPIFAFFLISISSVKANEVSDECLQSMQKVYKFYYHEIVPKAGDAADQLGTDKTNEMQMVVGNLKTSCSPEVVAKMNQFLQTDSQG